MLRRIAVGIVIGWVLSSGLATAEIKPDFLMETNPEIHTAPREFRFELDFKSLWIQALDRPEVDLQRMAAETIALAHQEGVPHLIQAVPSLEKILLADDSHLTARYAAARALISLNSRDSAGKLFDAAEKYGADLRQLVEPILAEWKPAESQVPIRTVWTRRLEDANRTRPRDLLLAIRGLGEVGEVTVRPQLLKLTHELTRASGVRIESASSLGLLVEQGLEADAERLARDGRGSSIVNRHCAVRLLARQTSDEAKALLIELAKDQEPSIASAALGRLNSIDSNLVLPLAGQSIQNADPKVREEVSKALFRFPTIGRIGMLAELLDDPHPSLRRQVCQWLYDLAQDAGLRDSIQNAANNILSRDGWRGQEQASLLLGKLEFQPAATRMSELLESTRVEVMISSAWGLRKLAVRETIPAIIDKIKRQTEARKIKELDGVDLQVAHLFEACGQMRVAEAEPLMFEYVPKLPPLGVRSRPAAIWALGWLHEGKPDSKTGTALIGRVTDTDLFPPETELVKLMSAISLARTRSVEHAPRMRALIEKGASNTALDLALIWAIHELTGEEFPVPGPEIVYPSHWFLIPLSTREPQKPL